MVAGVAAVAYGAGFGFIGLYISRPDRRGEGHRRAVWDAAMARPGQRAIGLDGVPPQRANYRSMGFAVACRTIRFSGRAGTSAAVDSAVVSVAPVFMPALIALDSRCFPGPRPAFVARWTSPPHTALAIVRNGECAGYGVLRRCREGSKIGLLFTGSDRDATSLLAGLAVAAAGQDLHIDVPAIQGRFIESLEDAGLSPGFETARMYRGAPPRTDQAAVFGVTSLELG